EGLAQAALRPPNRYFDDRLTRPPGDHPGGRFAVRRSGLPRNPGHRLLVLQLTELPAATSSGRDRLSKWQSCGIGPLPIKKIFGCLEEKSASVSNLKTSPSAVKVGNSLRSIVEDAWMRKGKLMKSRTGLFIAAMGVAVCSAARAANVRP